MSGARHLGEEMPAVLMPHHDQTGQRQKKNQESEIREIEYFMCISVSSSGQLANPDLGIESINYIKLDRNFKQWRVVSRTTQ